MSSTCDQDRRRRNLRREIARLRRRIDRRVRSTGREGRRLMAWQTYVRRYPGWAVAAAFGVGLGLASGLHPKRWSRALGLRLVRRAFDRFVETLLGELADVWSRSSPESGSAETAGGDDG